MQPQTETLKKTMQELATLRDEIRLNLHLAGMDARSEWDKLQPKLRDLEMRVEQGGGKTAKLAREVRSALEELRELVQEPRVSELMTQEVVACSVGDSLRRALQIMWDHDCGAVPVVDSDDKPIAMITDRDLSMAAYTRGGLDVGGPVVTTMSKDLFSCVRDQSIDDALATMRRYQIRRLVVVEPEGKLAGILSLADIARWAKRHKSRRYLERVAHTLATISEPRA